MMIFTIFSNFHTDIISLCSDGLYLSSFLVFGQTVLNGAPDIVQNSLLGMVIFLSALGLGWAGKRLLGKDGVLENTAAAVKLNAQATEKIGDLIDNHDKRQMSHHGLCEESSAGVKKLQIAAVVACDQVEEICREHRIEVGDRIHKVREALKG
jgi:hypothetical protein